MISIYMVCAILAEIMAFVTVISIPLTVSGFNYPSFISADFGELIRLIIFLSLLVFVIIFPLSIISIYV